MCCGAGLVSTASLVTAGSTNAAERRIRPIALNRKNALFAGSERKTASDSAEPMAE